VGKLAEDGLTTAQVEALLLACSWRAPTRVRNATLIAVLWRCGLRISEDRGAELVLPSDVVAFAQGSLMVAAMTQPLPFDVLP
jgi:site-specific recombinase XerD